MEITHEANLNELFNSNFSWNHQKTYTSFNDLKGIEGNSCVWIRLILEAKFGDDPLKMSRESSWLRTTNKYAVFLF